jgi:hypothetical protein
MVPHNALTVEEIINGSPNPALPKIENEHTCEDIKIATRLLNATESSVSSMSGGGSHGHLVIIVNTVEYAFITTMPWAETHNPGPIPVIAHDTDPVDAAQLVRIYDEFRRIHTNRVNVDQALKRILLEAYDKMYTS